MAELTEREGRARRREWALSSSAFERLLAVLGPDPASAGERYERIREKLTRLFEWRGCSDAAALVDRTFDRVARRLDEGAEVTAADPYAFLHGVALHVLQEDWRGAARMVPGLDEVEGHSDLVVWPAETPEEETEHAQGLRLECLERCLSSLPDAGRRLLERYHDPDAPDRTGRRQALAAELGITLNALRIQAFRLRARVQGCVEECARRRSGEAKRILPSRITVREGGRR